MCVQHYSLKLCDRAVKASDRRARATKNRSKLKSISLPHSGAQSVQDLRHKLRACELSFTSRSLPGWPG